MGLWTRIKRSMRALFGGMVEATEDPELILHAELVRQLRLAISLENARLEVSTLGPLLGPRHRAESYPPAGAAQRKNSAHELAGFSDSLGERLCFEQGVLSAEEGLAALVDLATGLTGFSA